MKKIIAFTAFLCTGLNIGLAQIGEDKGQFSGNFQTNTQFYVNDDKINTNTTQYQKELSSTDAWLFLNYQQKGFKFSARYDVFNNSPLLNPSGEAFTDHGIGFWQIRKEIDDLDITVGSFYDQFGSGAAFRAFEERLLGLDYAIEGIRLIYRPTDNLQLKGFTGRQKGDLGSKDRFETSPEVVKGFNVENRFNLGENIPFDVGASWVNRTLTQENSMADIVTSINSYDLEDRFIPKYNTYVYNGYATLGLGDFSLKGEYNYKTAEANRIQDENNDINLRNVDGQLYSAGLSYSKRKIGKKKKASIGINAQYRYMKDFIFRTSPLDNFQNGLLSYTPSLTRENSYTLLARYNGNGQTQGENGFQGDITFTPRKGTTIIANYSSIRSLDGNGKNGKAVDLFREAYLEVSRKMSKKVKLKLGIQSVLYNQDIYEQKGGVDNVETITPFGEINYLMNKKKKKSLRFEFQYLSTNQDLGSFLNTVLEYTVAPQWSFALGDMINVDPQGRKDGVKTTLADEVLHFPTVFVGYTKHTTTFSLAYKKQVEGINCTGGVCRQEPAFSGVRFSLTTSF
jgi:hypothetical protein